MEGFKIHTTTNFLHVAKFKYAKFNLHTIVCHECMHVLGTNLLNVMHLNNFCFIKNITSFSCLVLFGDLLLFYPMILMFVFILYRGLSLGDKVSQ